MKKDKDRKVRIEIDLNLIKETTSITASGETPIQRFTLSYNKEENKIVFIQVN